MLMATEALLNQLTDKYMCVSPLYVLRRRIKKNSRRRRKLYISIGLLHRFFLSSRSCVFTTHCLDSCSPRIAFIPIIPYVFLDVRLAAYLAVCDQSVPLSVFVSVT
jgi:hypothetical protein